MPYIYMIIFLLFSVLATVNATAETHHHEEKQTTIETGMAEKNGIKTERASSQTINHYLAVTGRIVANPNTTAQMCARFSGIVKNVFVGWGEKVSKGQALVRIESDKSLTNYTITSPINGVITQRNTNIGDITGTNVLFVISDYATVWAQVNIFQENAKNIHIGQSVTIQSLDGEEKITGKISLFLPNLDANSQTRTAVIPIKNDNNAWSPDMLVKGQILTTTEHVPLAVKTSALQTLEGLPVVFEKINDTYKARPLALGIHNGEWTEVISGLTPDAEYVTENSFVIKADIEKSEASHDD